jgi:hypothetical protein
MYVNSKYLINTVAGLESGKGGSCPRRKFLEVAISNGKNESFDVFNVI